MILKNEASWISLETLSSEQVRLLHGKVMVAGPNPAEDSNLQNRARKVFILFSKKI